MRIVSSNGSRDASQMRGLLDALKIAGSGTPNGGLPRTWVNLCASRQTISRVSFAHPTMLLAALGRKTVVHGDQVHTTDDSKLIIVPAGVDITVENAPHPVSGLYAGAALSFDRDVLDQFRRLYGERFEDWDLLPRWSYRHSEKLLASIVNWLNWSRDFDASKIELRHRMMEILLVLAEEGGAGNLLIDRIESMSARLRSVFALDPSRAWRASEVCERLGMSVSSLQRKLREQDTSFRQVLEEVRLSRGLELVLNTDEQIGRIAHNCGYESQSRFAERFRLRFSVSPSELRLTRPTKSAFEARLAERQT